MSTRTPALVLVLLAACTREAPPDAPANPPPVNDPQPAGPVVTADYTPPAPIGLTGGSSQPPPSEPPPSQPPLQPVSPYTSGPPGPITGAPPLRTPPPGADTPAAIAVAVASVQISRDCPDEPTSASPARTSTRDDAAMRERETSESRSSSRSPNRGPPVCEQSTLQLSLTNTGGRSSTLALEQVRILDGSGKRVLGTLPSRKPTYWQNDTYRPWNEQIPGNLTAQVAYRLGEPIWHDGDVVALTMQPYFIEVTVNVDGRKRTIRSAEIIPRNFDLVET